MDNITDKLEDYLESVLILEEKQKVARVKELAEMLGVRPPTVSAAIQRLVDLELVEHEYYGYIRLTTKGREEAERVYARHKALFHFLVQILKIDSGTALPQACDMEHAISAETRVRLEKLTEFIISNPSILKKWQEFIDETDQK